MYTYTRAPALDDPANTAALYVRQESPVVEPAYQEDTSGMLSAAGPRSGSPSSSPGVTHLPGDPANREACQDQPAASQPPTDRQEDARIESADADKQAATRPDDGNAAPPESGTRDQHPDAEDTPAEDQTRAAPPGPPEADLAGREPTPAPGPSPTSHRQGAETAVPARVPSITETISNISEALNASRSAGALEEVPSQADPSPEEGLGSQGGSRGEAGPRKRDSAVDV